MYCLVLESKTQCFYTNIFALNHFSTNKKKKKNTIKAAVQVGLNTWKAFQFLNPIQLLC